LLSLLGTDQTTRLTFSQKYFRLETPLAPLYKEWSEADTRLSKIAAVIPGCRILRQDPIECMFSFICSSNNNIPRITKMLTAFRKDYGQFMMKVPTQTGEDYVIFSFPTLEALSSATEDDLRSMGLGYRAKYITETRDLLKECGGGEYLLNLRKETNAQMVQDELIKFSGIGRKVADCIALFSLDSDQAIPVDVHVQHIASRDYDPTVLGSAKSITPTIYKRVGDLFRSRFPSYAGWAHSLLFVAELPSFRGVLPSDIVQQMDRWRDEEQRKKLEQKQQKKAPSD
jgi:N-glycosylase/DNA lyase